MKPKAAAKSPERYEKDHKNIFYDLCTAIKDTKREFQTKPESRGNNVDTCLLWQSLRAITGYNTKSGSIVGNNIPNPDEINTFYARFKKVDGRTKFAQQPRLSLYSPSRCRYKTCLPWEWVRGKQLAQLESLPTSSRPMWISWQEYSRISVTSHYSFPKFPPALRRPLSSQCHRNA